MTFKKKLEAVCKKCKPNSIRLYLHNVKRLYRLIDSDSEEIPDTGGWLKNPDLFKKVATIPVNKRRHLTLAAVKAADSYSVPKLLREKWYSLMMKDSDAYQAQRNKNIASPYEKKMLPKGGMIALRKAATEIKKRLKHDVFSNKEPSLKGLYKYQFFIALKLFTQVGFRNTFPTIHIGNREKGNILVTPKKGNFKFLMREYKNSDRLGEKTVNLNRANSMALRKFLKYRDGLVTHDRLFTGYNGEVMTRGAFGKALQKTYLRILGKPLGSRLIRVIWANENKELIRASKELSDKLLHSQKQTEQYIKE